MLHPMKLSGRHRALVLHTGLLAVAAAVATAVWGATGGGSWILWVLIGLSISPGIHASVVWGLTFRGNRERGLAIHGAISVVLAIDAVCVWGLSGSEHFWAVWIVAPLGAAVAVHALLAYLVPTANEQALTERVDELTRTRRGALDVQAAELRRIERDLHDGAQARLVALSMHLGRVETRLGDQPETAELVRRARSEATAAIAELRDLARGIAPPVLADRGLVAAAEALGRRSAIVVRVEGKLETRPVPVVETAAYFVVSEALTNVAKHATYATARVLLAERDGVLVVEVADDGPGGADADGAGLTGLRHRVEALDGHLTVTSAPGTGTLVRVELPCAS
jgi:signal transduction histidine kinase